MSLNTCQTRSFNYHARLSIYCDQFLVDATCVILINNPLCIYIPSDAVHKEDSRSNLTIRIVFNNTKLNGSKGRARVITDQLSTASQVEMALAMGLRQTARMVGS